MGGAVLIVEDERGVSWALDRLLKSMGYQALVADTGRGALELSARHAFCLAVVDAKLPDMDGIDLETAIHQAHPGLPIILISGYFQEGDSILQEWIKAARVCSFFAKPFEHAAVRKAVEKAVSLHGGR